MKMSNLVGERLKERPSDCVTDSQGLMIRGGYMKPVANGIYSMNPPLKNITRKIEQIIREEMEGIGGQEVLFPVVLPEALWEESGRSLSVGRELLRFQDRNGSSLVLGMTHEEAAVHLVRDYARTYVKYPFMIYQIQTKFRDEARPRAGLIRVREFTMKDAYSFHTSQEDLEEYYYKCHHAYERIFARAGLPEVISVSSDSGMMGGSISHEFMLLTPIGEDTLVLCKECDYKANMETAKSILRNPDSLALSPLKMVQTPDITSIEELADFLGIPVENTCKAVVYQTNETDEAVLVFIRGDLEVNETKVTNFLGREIHPAAITKEGDLIAGYIGPHKLEGNHKVLFDRSLRGINNLACGANIPEYHYTGLHMERDYKEAEYHDFATVKEGGICPVCGRPALTVQRGIEVGNIFQLGTKYTRAMNMQYTDKEGISQYPFMGCYGIGIGRLAASVCEKHHDEYGPVWPVSIAPWHVHLCCLRGDDRDTKIYADALYQEMLAEKMEVIYDDRTVRAGVMFSDADLMGVPVRVIVSPKNIREESMEVISRDKSISLKVKPSDLIWTIKKLLNELNRFSFFA